MRMSKFNKYVSKREFFEYFDGEFRDKYEEDKAHAIEKLKVGEDG